MVDPAIVNRFALDACVRSLYCPTLFLIAVSHDEDQNLSTGRQRGISFFVVLIWRRKASTG